MMEKAGSPLGWMRGRSPCALGDVFAGKTVTGQSTVAIVTVE